MGFKQIRGWIVNRLFTFRGVENGLGGIELMRNASLQDPPKKCHWVYVVKGFTIAIYFLHCGYSIETLLGKELRIEFLKYSVRNAWGLLQLN